MEFILASGSPRRRQLLEQIGLRDFTVRPTDADESLPAGTRVVEREGRQGRTARTVKRYYAANGTLLREETVYEDTYRSIAARIYVSTDLYAEETAAAAAPAG